MATEKKDSLPPPPPLAEPKEEKEETSEQESGEGGEESEAEEESPPAPESEGVEEESESEEESGDESDSPSSPRASDFTVKPIAPTKPASEDAKPPSKRPSDAPKDDGKDLRARKKAKIDEGEEKKEKGSSAAVFASGSAGRVWSDDDEIAVLKGMIYYQKTRGADPSADMTAFHEFVKGMFHVEMSRTQVYEKVRRLKIKFFANVKKAERGEDVVFSKPHEARAFRLSKKIWDSGVQSNVNAKGSAAKARKGGGIVGEGERKAITRGRCRAEEGVKEDEVMEAGEFQSNFPYLNWSISVLEDSPSVLCFMKENLSLIGDAKARELDAKWKKLHKREAKFVFKWMNLMAEQIKLVLDAAK